MGGRAPLSAKCRVCGRGWVAVQAELRRHQACEVEYDEALFEALRAWRRREGRGGGRPGVRGVHRRDTDGDHGAEASDPGGPACHPRGRASQPGATRRRYSGWLRTTTESTGSSGACATLWTGGVPESRARWCAHTSPVFRPRGDTSHATPPLTPPTPAATGAYAPGGAPAGPTDTATPHQHRVCACPGNANTGNRPPTVNGPTTARSGSDLTTRWSSPSATSMSERARSCSMVLGSGV